MPKHLLTAMLCVAVAGCGGPETNIDKLAKFRDRFCACKSSQCMDEVDREIARWAKALDPKTGVNEQDQQRSSKLFEAMGECRKRAIASSYVDAGPVAAGRSDAAVVALPDGAPPKAAGFDPAAPLFGLGLQEVNGWVPQSPREEYVGFKLPGQIVAIRVPLIESSPEDAAALRKDKDLVALLALDNVKKVSKETKTPHGWNAIVTGKGIEVSLDMQVYVEIVRHGPHTLMCSANLSSLIGDPIKEADARAVCGSLYPKP